MKKTTLISVLILAIIGIIFISGCIKQEITKDKQVDKKEIKTCPYECCEDENPGNYATKECSDNLTCKFYICIAETVPDKYKIETFSFERISTNVAFCDKNSKIKMTQADDPDLDWLTILSRDTLFYAPLGDISQEDEGDFMPNRMGYEVFAASLDKEPLGPGSVKEGHYFVFESVEEAKDFMKKRVAAGMPISVSVSNPYYNKPEEQNYQMKYGYDKDTVYGYDENYVYVHSYEGVGVPWENFLKAWHYDANYYVMFLSKNSELKPVSTLNVYNTIKEGAKWSKGIHNLLMSVREGLGHPDITADELSIAREVKEIEAKFWEKEGYPDLAEQIIEVAKAYKGFELLHKEYGESFDPKTDGIKIWEAALDAEEAVIWPEFSCETDYDCAPICSDNKVTETKCINGICTAGQELGCWVKCGAECEMPKKGCEVEEVCNPLICSCINI